MSPAINIRPARMADCEAIARIYNHYIRETVITFEEQEISGAEIALRLAEVEAANLPWLIAEEANTVIGYAYGGKWKGRCAYRYASESSVYLAAEQTGRGFGRLLYTSLMDEFCKRSIHTVIGGIALPNPASIALHERLGFVKSAEFKEVGYKFSRWIDVGYWQKML